MMLRIEMPINTQKHTVFSSLLLLLCSKLFPKTKQTAEFDSHLH